MKPLLITLFLLISAAALAPDVSIAPILAPESINPYMRIANAVGKVESKEDTLAYNPKEEATGYFQIRPVRLLDYNIRTGSHYVLRDLYDYNISLKIFLYYASQFEPWEMEKIATDWNKATTDVYWKLVKAEL